MKGSQRIKLLFSVEMEITKSVVPLRDATINGGIAACRYRIMLV